jgi:hypothetical protein
VSNEDVPFNQANALPCGELEFARAASREYDGNRNGEGTRVVGPNVGSRVAGASEGTRVVGRFVGGTGAREGGTTAASVGRSVMGEGAGLGAEGASTGDVKIGTPEGWPVSATSDDPAGSVGGSSSSKNTTGTSTAIMRQAAIATVTKAHRFHGKAVIVSGGGKGRHQ